MACILLWSSAVRVHDSQAQRGQGKEGGNDLLSTLAGLIAKTHIERGRGEECS